MWAQFTHEKDLWWHKEWEAALSLKVMTQLTNYLGCPWEFPSPTAFLDFPMNWALLPEKKSSWYWGHKVSLRSESQIPKYSLKLVCCCDPSIASNQTISCLIILIIWTAFFSLLFPFLAKELLSAWATTCDRSCTARHTELVCVNCHALTSKAM